MVNSELKKICTRPATEPITAQAENDGATMSTTLSSCSDTSDLISDIDETDSAQPSPRLALQYWDSDKSDSEDNNSISGPETAESEENDNCYSNSLDGNDNDEYGIYVSICSYS